ncbi:MAG TPA: hypothetical protein VL346_08720 [Acidobacteriaceae bacterium]|nr:hypothetical protein [Acidobacteriaceae bacterium]
MGKGVYLIGHGRVDPATPVIVPPTITVHWLGHLGDVSNGLSYAFLGGTLTAELGTSGPGSSFPQHYLCGERNEQDDVVDTKIKNFFGRQTPFPGGSQDPYVLYARAKTNVSIESIFAFLEMLSPTQEWHLYWTCCRGYLGQKNPYTSKFDKASGTVVRALRTDPEATPLLNNTKENHLNVNAGFNSIRMVAKSDQGAVEGQMSKQKGWMKSQSLAIETLLKL